MAPPGTNGGLYVVSAAFLLLIDNHTAGSLSVLRRFRCGRVRDRCRRGGHPALRERAVLGRPLCARERPRGPRLRRARDQKHLQSKPRPFRPAPRNLASATMLVKARSTLLVVMRLDHSISIF